MSEKTSNWSEIKKRLEPFDKGDLITVIKDLHSLSKENKNFLSARFASDRNQILEKIQGKSDPAFLSRKMVDLEALNLLLLKKQ